MTAVARRQHPDLRESSISLSRIIHQRPGWVELSSPRHRDNVSGERGPCGTLAAYPRRILMTTTTIKSSVALLRPEVARRSSIGRSRSSACLALCSLAGLFGAGRSLRLSLRRGPVRIIHSNSASRWSMI